MYLGSGNCMWNHFFFFFLRKKIQTFGMTLKPDIPFMGGITMCASVCVVGSQGNCPIISATQEQWLCICFSVSQALGTGEFKPDESKPVLNKSVNWKPTISTDSESYHLSVFTMHGHCPVYYTHTALLNPQSPPCYWEV